MPRMVSGARQALKKVSGVLLSLAAMYTSSPQTEEKLCFNQICTVSQVCSFNELTTNSLKTGTKYSVPYSNYMFSLSVSTQSTATPTVRPFFFFFN